MEKKQSLFQLRVSGKQIIAMKEAAEAKGQTMSQFARERINFEDIIAEKDARFDEWNQYSLGLLKKANVVIELKNQEIAKLKKQLK